MASTKAQDSAVRHFLYPLNPGAEYVFIGADGEEVPTSYAEFRKSLDYAEAAEWGLATGHRKVRARDLMWAYFAKPEGAIRAVGRVREDPHWNSNWGRWAIWIDWDRTLTERLAKDPIRYEEYGQRVQAAVNEANARTLVVLGRWLDANQSTRSRTSDTAVTFVAREVEARLGQREFRSNLMKAYDNRCAITGCEVETVLQAAHIRGVRDGGDHGVANGLLLRADIHNLFDRGLIWIDADLKTRVAPELKGSEYAQYDGRKLLRPTVVRDRPSKSSLRRHRLIHGR
ncbi:MAG: HNH endonuclease [Ilumatobacter sp.]|uniref:HNH endonuclease n=1 Tax=Ilumatobacter sp. TaxID=1967498 RepID=UPI00391DECDE